jgi:hypothetical protein
MYPFCYDYIGLEDLMVVKGGDPLWSVHCFESLKLCLVLVRAGEMFLGGLYHPLPPAENLTSGISLRTPRILSLLWLSACGLYCMSWYKTP